jgi:peroxiredoxin family protein
MTLALESRTEDPFGSLADRVRELEGQVAALRAAGGEGTAIVRGADRVDRLSMIVFSGSLDRLIAAFVLATGASSMGMEVDMFFTFWGTAALRQDNVHVPKSFMERMFGWMLPKGSTKLPLSQMNMAGMGPVMIRGIMKKKGVASLEEMIALSSELGVKINVCTMSMDLLGMREGEMIQYPGLSYCGVATFLETAAPGKLTLFL